jgi:hypothetical protein
MEEEAGMAREKKQRYLANYRKRRNYVPTKCHGFERDGYKVATELSTVMGARFSIP